MKQIDTFIIIRRFRQQKKENNIKLKELIKRVTEKQDINDWSNEPSSPIKRKKFITKSSRDKPRSLVGQNQDYSSMQNLDTEKMKEAPKDYGYTNPFIEGTDDKEWIDWKLKIDHQDSVTTQDMMLGVDNYFTF